jgi:hypothetical protein
MSACWVSRFSRLLRNTLPAVAALLLATAAADARVRISVDSADSGRTVKRVHITSNGITVDRAVEGDHGVVVLDSLAGGALVVDSGGGMVRLFSDARVPAGDQIDGDVVAVFGSAHVAGKVTGSVVAVFGSVDFEPGASVGGDAVAVGGGVEDVAGVRIGGQTVSVGIQPLTLGLPGMPIMFSMLVLGWIVTLFFGWVFSALFPERLARVAVTSSRRTLLSFLLGVLVFLGMPMVSILLIVTVIGIPIGIMLPFVYVALAYAGQIAGTYVLGCKLTRRRLGSGGAMPAIVAGSLLVGFFFAVGVALWSSPGTVRTVAVFFHLVGILVLAGLSVIGSGAFILSRLGTWPERLDDAGGAVAGVTPTTEAGQAPAAS